MDWIADAFRNRLFASVSAILDAACNTADNVMSGYSGNPVLLDGIDLADFSNDDFSLITP